MSQSNPDLSETLARNSGWIFWFVYPFVLWYFISKLYRSLQPFLEAKFGFIIGLYSRDFVTFVTIFGFGLVAFVPLMEWRLYYRAFARLRTEISPILVQYSGTPSHDAEEKIKVECSKFVSKFEASQSSRRFLWAGGLAAFSLSLRNRIITSIAQFFLIFTPLALMTVKINEVISREAGPFLLEVVHAMSLDFLLAIEKSSFLLTASILFLAGIEIVNYSRIIGLSGYNELAFMQDSVFLGRFGMLVVWAQQLHYKGQYHSIKSVDNETLENIVDDSVFKTYCTMNKLVVCFDSSIYKGPDLKALSYGKGIKSAVYRSIYRLAAREPYVILGLSNGDCVVIIESVKTEEGRMANVWSVSESLVDLMLKKRDAYRLNMKPFYKKEEP